MLDALNSKKAYYNYQYGNETYKIPMDIIKRDYSIYISAGSQNDKTEARTIVIPITEKEIRAAITSLQMSDKLAIEDGLLFIKRYYDEEFNIAYYIQQINRNKVVINNLDIDKIVNNYCEKNNISLEQKQREAVIEICKNFGGINIINGAAGCGKTFCIKVALTILEKIYRNKYNTFSKVIIAPTGKATRVAFKATGIESYTIHRLLQYKPNEGFYYNSHNHLPYDCIVIDECSMLDTHLAYQLFSAIDSTTKVIMMGDTNQLPSVGSGNVFHDFINSEKIKVTTLNVIKRQGTDSGIVINARNIVDGVPITTQKERMDSIVIGVKDNDFTSKIKKYCDKILENTPMEELQILSPMKKGITGTNYLNFLIQSLYNDNPDSNRFLKGKFDVKIDDETKMFELYFRVGDKVINTKNDYQMPWYYIKDGTLFENSQKSGITNGEVGTIVKMIEYRDKYGDLNRKIIVKFEDKYIIYENDFDNLELAYAITIHKSQGSEWAAVMVVLNKQHKSMIDRNLFYTGITRSKQFCIVISDADTIAYGVRNTRSTKRNTGLQSRLQEMVSQPRQVTVENFDF